MVLNKSLRLALPEYEVTTVPETRLTKRIVTVAGTPTVMSPIGSNAKNWSEGREAAVVDSGAGSSQADTGCKTAVRGDIRAIAKIKVKRNKNV